MQYDEAYRKSQDYFGSEPTDILRDFVHLVDKSRPILDIGAGQGRNTFFLARLGFSVDGIDPTPASLEIIDRTAKKDNLPARAVCSGFEEFDSGEILYGAVLLFGIIQILSREGIRSLIRKTTDWLVSGGLVFITAFTIDDPSYAHNAETYRSIARNSFQSDRGEIFTYLEPGEILKLFKGYTVVHHEEGLGPMHRHGGSKPHQHASVKAVFRKE